jgi:hypothetical protein
MSSPVQLLLTVTPLAGYFYLLAIWQAGRHPRVIAGAVDATLLAVGVGGLILFGPFGQVVAEALFDRPGPLHWLLLTLTAALLVASLSRRSSRRLVVYHVAPETLESALRALLGPDGFVRTLDGYEDRARGRGLRVELSPRWQSAVVEARGRDPDALIASLVPRLRDRLRESPVPAAEVSMVFFGLSALTMLVPLTGYLLAQPHARAALRVLLEHLRGG